MVPEHSLRHKNSVHESELAPESAPESATDSAPEWVDGSVTESDAESDAESGADLEVLDLDHLARYTMGNRDLERELLRLFRAQIRTQVTGLAEARDAQDWRFATHTLKGVARSIGAWAIADTAEKLEQIGHGGDDRGVHARLMVDLATRIAACEREIARIVGR